MRDASIVVFVVMIDARNKITKSDNWITGGDNTYLKKIQCTNGYLSYDTTSKTWKEVKE